MCFGTSVFKLEKEKKIQVYFETEKLLWNKSLYYAVNE